MIFSTIPTIRVQFGYADVPKDEAPERLQREGLRLAKLLWALAPVAVIQSMVWELRQLDLACGGDWIDFSDPPDGECLRGDTCCDRWLHNVVPRGEP